MIKISKFFIKISFSHKLKFSLQTTKAEPIAKNILSISAQNPYIRLGFILFFSKITHNRFFRQV